MNLVDIIKKIQWVIDLLIQLVDTKYTGKLEINFFQGGIASLNKFESIKPPQP